MANGQWVELGNEVLDTVSSAVNYAGASMDANAQAAQNAQNYDAMLIEQKKREALQRSEERKQIIDFAKDAFFVFITIYAITFILKNRKSWQ